MMKKILIQLFIILAILLLADRLGMYLFQKAIFTHTISGESGGSVNYLLQKKKDAELIIMGSSRAKHHIDPELLALTESGKSYNAGINGTGGLIYNNRLLHILLEKGIKPKTIILQLDAYPYFTQGNEELILELSQLYPFIAESPSLQNYVSKHGGLAEQIKLFLHSYRFNGKMLNIFYNYKKRQSIADHSGFSGLDGTLKDSVVKGIPETAIKPEKFSKLKLQALSDIAQTCIKNNIRLIVVFPPSYKNGLFTAKGTSAIIHVCKKEGIRDILDLSDIRLFPTLGSAIYWKDATHLNKEGAAVFSKELNRLLSN
jgi:hypothetical protein